MSSNAGGYLRGPWWRYVGSDKETTRRCFVIAWGRIVRQPLEWVHDDKRTIKFVIKTGRGADRNEKHLLCAAYGNTIVTTVMSAMEREDVVFVAGTWTEKLSKTKKRGVHPTYECRVNFIVPCGLIGFLLRLYATPAAQKMVEDYANEAPDPWESE